MRISLIIEKIGELPWLPILLTENSKSKTIRVIAMTITILWFTPAVLIFITIAGLLAIPAMLQDAWRG